MQAGRYEESVVQFSNVRFETMPACLPERATDELEASVDLYLLVAMTAAELKSKTTNIDAIRSLTERIDGAEKEQGDGELQIAAGSKRKRKLREGLHIDAGADPAVHSHALTLIETLQGVFGKWAAQAMILEPSVERTEVCYLCGRMAGEGDEVMRAVWRSVVDASCIVWGSAWWEGEGVVWYGTDSDLNAPVATTACVSEVPREDGSKLPEAAFWRKYMFPNMPVVLHNAGVSDWRIAKEWVTGDGTIDAQAIRVACGDSCVVVHDCSDRITGYDTMPTMEMKVEEYLDWWTKGREGEHPDRPTKLLYLKDWNLTKDKRFGDLYVWPVRTTRDSFGLDLKLTGSCWAGMVPTGLVKSIRAGASNEPNVFQLS